MAPMSFLPALQPVVETSMYSSEPLPSRVLVLNQIMDALKDPSLNTIGVYGVEGTGNTTLAMEVCAQARKEKFFDIVIMISVSRFPNLRKIQAEIAGALGLNFDAEEDFRRASKLYQRLQRAKILVVLDDVWENLNLHDVGIPVGDDCHGCKLLVSSRTLGVLSSELGSQKDFLVGFLRGEETWILFQTIAPKVSFSNLTSLVVEKRNNLKYVFTTSMVKCLVQLKTLVISNCELVEAIIQNDKIEENEEEIISTIVFRKLDFLSLYGLPNVKMFSCGYEIEFPSLRELSIECPAMTNFVSKFSDRNSNYNGDEYLFNELVTFSNLESMIVRNMDTFRYLWHEKFILDDSFSKLKSLNIANCSRLSVVFPVNAYKRIQRLEALYLSCCDGIEEIFQFEETKCGEIHVAEEFALRDMRIVNLASLKYVLPNTMAYSLLKLEQLEINNCNVQVIFNEESKDEKSQGITCFEDASLQRVEMLREMEVNSPENVIVFPRLCSLKLKNLPHLAGFCNKREQGFGVQVSFPGLKGLELCACKNFKYIFTSTVVNSFVLLEKIAINNCELVEEIVLSRKFDQIDSVEGIEKIVFPKLEYLSLEELPNLKTFAFGYSFEFQSLKELSISYSPVLKNFVSKHLGNASDEYLFNEMVTFSNLERMKVSHSHSFKYLWDEQFTVGDSFLKLKSLRIEYCSNISVVFPSSIYRRFQGLEKLYLCCCSKVEEIYQYEGINFEELNSVEPVHLQDLELQNLPSLKYIWSKDPPGASTFEYLQSVKVVSCKDLMFVFPKSVARRLLQLQHLKISNSDMEFIIANSDMEFIIANTNVKESSFIVPKLTVLQLENLYQLRNFYEGPYTFKCPKLKQFEIHGCNQAMNLRSEIRSLQLCGFDQVMRLGSKMSVFHKEKSLSFVSKKFIRNLEELALDDQGLKLVLSPELGVEFSKLKRVTVRSLEQDSAPLLSSLLRRCSLEKLVFAESYLEEIFLLGNGEAFRNHLRLRHLELVGDDNLKHILKKDSRFNPTLEKLLTLNVEFCESLIDIAPSAATFSNLASLNISVCFKMTNLVTASTAKTMTSLTELKVSECYMMEHIVENDEMNDVYICFYKLKCLELYDLPTLSSFSSSNNSFKFPSLERVVVKDCIAMKNFCSREVNTPKLQAIQFQDEQLWKGDFNATIAFQVKSRVAKTYSWAT